MNTTMKSMLAVAAAMLLAIFTPATALAAAEAGPELWAPALELLDVDLIVQTLQYGLAVIGLGFAVTITEESTPDDHQVRSVDETLTEKAPSKAPIDTLMRRMGGMTKPAKNEKEEWEEDDQYPRDATAAASVASGASITISLSAGEGALFRVDDQVKLPDDSHSVGVVTAVSGDDITVDGLGDNLAVSAGGNRVKRMANAKVDFSDASGSRTGFPSQFYNFVQTFDTVIKISGRRRATENYTRDDWERNKDRQIYDFRQSMESAIVDGKRYKGTRNGESFTTMGGILSFITTNSLTYSASTFDEGVLIDWCEQVFGGNNGSDVRYLCADRTLTSDLAKIPLDKVRRNQIESKTLKMEVTRIETEHGVLVVIPHDILNELGYSRFGMILDMANLQKKVLRPLETNVLDLKGSGQDGYGLQLLEEFTILVRYEETHAVINGSA